MITHVVVELEFPVEEEYWSQVDYSDEYYGIGRPLTMCKDCKYAYKSFNSYTCQRVFYSFTIEDDGFCSWAERKEE